MTSSCRPHNSHNPQAVTSARQVASIQAAAAQSTSPLATQQQPKARVEPTLLAPSPTMCALLVLAAQGALIPAGARPASAAGLTPRAVTMRPARWAHMHGSGCLVCCLMPTRDSCLVVRLHRAKARARQQEHPCTVVHVQFRRTLLLNARISVCSTVCCSTCWRRSSDAKLANTAAVSSGGHSAAGTVVSSLHPEDLKLLAGGTDVPISKLPING